MGDDLEVQKEAQKMLKSKGRCLPTSDMVKVLDLFKHGSTAQSYHSTLSHLDDIMRKSMSKSQTPSDFEVLFRQLATPTKGLLATLRRTARLCLSRRLCT